MRSIDENFARRRSFGEYVVSLNILPERIRTGEKTALRYEIAKNGEPVRDLEHYLGAPMHLAIVRTDLTSFIHAHGDTPGSAHDYSHASHTNGIARRGFGPEIASEVIFPKKGTYKIFSQIQHKGKIILLDFMLEVE